MIDNIRDLWIIDERMESFAHAIVSDGSDNVPEGRLRDGPFADITPLGPQYPSITDGFAVHFPLAILTNDNLFDTIV